MDTANAETKVQTPEQRANEMAQTIAVMRVMENKAAYAGARKSRYEGLAARRSAMQLPEHKRARMQRRLRAAGKLLDKSTEAVAMCKDRLASLSAQLA